MKKNIKNLLKNKKLLFAPWAATEEDNYQRRDWIPALKKIFTELIIFSPRDNYFRCGKEAMNRKFLEMIKKEKPDFIIMTLSYDEFFIETLKKIRKICPNIKIINLFGDDDWRFDDFSRYYALFFDCSLTYKKDKSNYIKEDIKNAYFIWGAATNFFKPLNIKKEHDVTFIGMPLADRYEYIKFLKDNGINIKLFGKGWEKYSDLKDIYGGFLESEDFVKIINQTKINLNLAKTFYKKGEQGQLKGRLIEMPACNAFVLTEHTPMNIGFFKKHKEVNFKNKEELLTKINYFLKHKEEREKLAEEAYKEVIKNCNWEAQFRKIFEKLTKDKNFQYKGVKEILRSDKKIVSIEENNFKDIGKLKKRIKNYDYISFKKGDNKNHKYKNYFQIYSLEKSGRDISCCDYYVYSNGLGNYLLFSSKKAFHNLNKDKFAKLLNINQLVVKKSYFLKSIDKFKEAFNEKEIDFIDETNTVFVSIPLVQLKRINIIDYDSMKKVFQMKFRDKLYSLVYQKKIFFDPYPYNLITESIFGGKVFLLRYLAEFLSEREVWTKLKNK